MGGQDDGGNMAMMLEKSYTDIDLVFTKQIVGPGGSLGPDISTGAVSVAAVHMDGAKVVGSAAVVDIANRIIEVRFPAGALKAGLWKTQVQIVLADDARTFADHVTIVPTAFP